MNLQTFYGDQASELMARVRDALGPDAVLLSIQAVDSPEGRLEAVAAPADEETSWDDVFRRSIRVSRIDRPEPPRPSGGRVIAFVGPTGAGKTTTVAKLLHSPEAFPGATAGVITLDTYRVGGLEQIRAWAGLAGCRVAVADDPAKALRALRRLDRCDVVLVDTPGRGPREEADEAEVIGTLGALEPDEVHLVLPAGLSPALLWKWIERGRVYGATHLLPTKLDELPGLEVLRALAQRGGLRMRWSATGQKVPADLEFLDRPAGGRAAADRASAWRPAGAARGLFR